MTDSKSTCEIDFKTFVVATNQDTRGTATATRQAEALIVWWNSFSRPGFLKKNPSCTVRESRSDGMLRLRFDVGDDTTGYDCDYDYERMIRLSMKKIQVEDLGNLRARDLLASIPEKDPQGRGRCDLREMETKLSVKIIFDDEENGGHGHVYLVGDGKKLQTKVFPIRNLLRHYHWRLSGNETN